MKTVKNSDSADDPIYNKPTQPQPRAQSPPQAPFLYIPGSLQPPCRANNNRLPMQRVARGREWRFHALVMREYNRSRGIIRKVKLNHDFATTGQWRMAG